MKDNNDNLSQSHRDEARELYEMGVETRKRMAELPEVKTDQEFARTMARVKPRRLFLLTTGWRNVAAAIALLVIGTVTAAVLMNNHGLNLIRETPNEMPTELPASPASMTVYMPNDSVAQSKPDFFTSSKVYEDMTLDNILREVATLFDVAVECATQKVDVRLYLSIPSGCTLKDLASLLNAFEQIDAEIVTGQDGSTKLMVK